MKKVEIWDAGRLKVWPPNFLLSLLKIFSKGLPWKKSVWSPAGRCELEGTDYLESTPWKFKKAFQAARTKLIELLLDDWGILTQSALFRHCLTNILITWHYVLIWSYMTWCVLSGLNTYMQLHVTARIEYSRSRLKEPDSADNLTDEYSQNALLLLLWGHNADFSNNEME